ncbi:hypothetical protein CEXT_38461 [Caerostris extrusa]|uniref:Uncharacterized protein n=1 Tax=Caerostris extrusa TaxID=172846 RepID=A0AAV4M6Y4_CAEEX|nr:hypothetical protein CEXT_38461 [Caerostris extrusa]
MESRWNSKSVISINLEEWGVHAFLTTVLVRNLYVAILDGKLLLKNTSPSFRELNGLGICPDHTVACKPNKSAKTLQEELCFGR